MPRMTSRDMHPYYGQTLHKFVTNLSLIEPAVVTMTTPTSGILHDKRCGRPFNREVESVKGFASLRGGRRQDRLI